MDARAWDERYAGAELVWSSRPNRFVEAEVAGLPPGLALDLAAGEGRNAIWLAEQGWQVTAVDFSSVGLDKGRRLLASHERARDLHVDWVHHDVLSFDPGPVGYDLALQLHGGGRWSNPFVRALGARTTAGAAAARLLTLTPARP